MQKEQSGRKYINIKVSKLPESEVEIEGEILAEEMEKYRTQAVLNLQKEITLPGFRKGHVDEKALINKFGEMFILEEASEIALGEAYPEIVTENNIPVIGRPNITITKIGRGNPLGFKIKTPIFPDVTLADYKKIAKEEISKKDELEVQDAEVEKVINQLRENKALAAKKEGDEKTEEKTLPEFNEEFVKSFGDFKNTDEFKQKIKENLVEEKKVRAKEKKRAAIGERMIKDSTISLPEVLIQSELRKMHAQFEEDLKRMGIKIEEYLNHLKKTIDDLKKEWRPSASDRAKLQIIINKIAEAENIKAPEEEIKKETDHILEHHKDADRENVSSYVEMVLTNEKVFEFLESQ